MPRGATKAGTARFLSARGDFLLGFGGVSVHCARVEPLQIARKKGEITAEKKKNKRLLFIFSFLPSPFQQHKSRQMLLRGVRT